MFSFNTFWILLHRRLLYSKKTLKVIIKEYLLFLVNSLKCFMCSSQMECQIENKSLTTCDYNSVDQTSRKLYLLPNALSQIPSTQYFCTQYKIFYGLFSFIHLFFYHISTKKSSYRERKYDKHSHWRMCLQYIQPMWWKSNSSHGRENKLYILQSQGWM